MRNTTTTIQPITPAAARAARIGGAALLLATVLFAAVFTWLAQHFGYPEVLDRPAAQVLPALLALGPTGRAVWLVYGLVPLLLLPAALGVQAMGQRAAPLAGRTALLAASLACLAMVAGLLRWPSLHWQLAQAQAVATPAAAEAIAAVFAGANSLLGTLIGEILGELFLNLFFLCAALVLRAAGGPGWRWLLWAGVAASALGTVAMLRHASAVVAPIADLNNAVLPLWMLVLGGALLRLGWAPRADAATVRCAAPASAV